jgi:transcriptional regulator with XRE-family HTH domain
MRASQTEPEPEVGPLARKLRRLTILKFNLDDDTKMFPTTQIAEGCSRLYVEHQILKAREKLAEIYEDEAVIEAQLAPLVEAFSRDKALLNRSYVSDLIHGKRHNPTKDVLTFLGKFFGVNPAYFFGEDERTAETEEAEAEVELIAVTRELARTLEQGGQPNAQKLLTAMMRGAQKVSPETAASMLRLQIAVLDQAAQDQQRG